MRNCADIVMAIDPGHAKCGLAVVCRTSGVLYQAVVEASDIAAEASAIAGRFSPDLILVGNGTCSRDVARAVSEIGLGPVKVVPEEHTTIMARRRYFREHPPRGLRRIIPWSLQIPCCPYDDYVAVILAENYFESVL